MPPEQNKNQNPPSRPPAIRTMKSDVDEFLKTARPSLASMLGTSQQNMAMAEERHPSKLPTILIITIVSIGIVGGGAFFISKFFSGGLNAGSPGGTKPAIQKLVPPAPFFATETSRTISVSLTDRPGFSRLIADSTQEKERDGTMKRIIIKVRDGPQERFATLGDFFDLWRIAPPSSLLDQIEAPLMVFIYYEKAGSRLGFAARTRAPDRTLADMLSWESGIFSAFTPLFLDEKINSTLIPFEDRTYRNIDWRYLKLSQDKDLGIAHALFPASNILLVTTSKEAMETTINRLFDAR